MQTESQRTFITEQAQQTLMDMIQSYGNLISMNMFTEAIEVLRSIQLTIQNTRNEARTPSTHEGTS